MRVSGVFLAAALVASPTAWVLLPAEDGVMPYSYIVGPVPQADIVPRGTGPFMETGGAQRINIPHVPGDSDVNRPLAIAGMDKLHELGIKAKDVRIAVIDTVVDYRHPSFGSGFGPGYKIAFRTDLLGGDYDSYNDPVPDDAPIATCIDGVHGTHFRAWGSVENVIISAMYHAHDNINRTTEHLTVLPLEGNFVVFVMGSGVDCDGPFGNPADICDERAFEVAVDIISELPDAAFMILLDGNCPGIQRPYDAPLGSRRSGGPDRGGA
ncbi:hypothetical protein DL769_010169 [Monosporascus sp. CRB-8-3]|nr:hypothetical protein DL769_010169 [Monosporascus sp. CRB-8-3]